MATIGTYVSEAVIQRASDGAFVPVSPGNPDYQQLMKEQADGGEILAFQPSDPVVSLGQVQSLALGQFPVVDLGGYLDLVGWEGQMGIGFAFRAAAGEFWFILAPEPANYVAMVDSFPRGAELSMADAQPGMFIVRVKDAEGTPFDPECVRISVSGVVS